MNRIHIIGRKNSGKTTLIEELVRHFTSLGLRVGTVKHTHHHHELDTPGKDSHRHRQAGAAAVGILSPQMNAVFWPRAASPGDKEQSYQSFTALMADCDLVLVEGDSATAAPKVEVYRKEIAREEPLAASDPTIVAVVSDDRLPIATPVWPRRDLAALAERLLALRGK